jgi:DNA-binding NarL/FixJ family response regulator
MSIATPEGTQLTERQAEFLQLLADGKSQNEIALMCGVSPSHVSSTLYEARRRQLAHCGDLLLTPRQLEILALVGEGYTDYQIGQRLYIATRTVGHLIVEARERLQASNRIQCVLMAVAYEMLILDSDGKLFVPYEIAVAA